MEGCLAWCTKHGIELSTDRFLDEGKSGYAGEHLGEKGQLRRFIDLVDAGKIEPGSYLIVESLDRLSRQNVWLAVPLFMNLIEKGIRIVTLMDDKVYTSAGGAQDLVLSIFVMIRAHEESATKASRAADKWQSVFKKARENGTPVGRRVSKWLMLEGDKYIVNEERAAIVRRVFDMCIRGHGLVAISQALNREGIPAFRDGTWCPSSVSDMLGNRAVLGEYQPKDGGPPIKHFFPQIVSDDTFHQAHAAWDTRRTGKVTRQAANFQLWQGVGVCAYCGAAMHSNRKHVMYLICSNKRKGLCDAKAIKMERSEAVFKQMLFALGTRVLVEDDTATTEKELTSVNGRLLELQALRDKHAQALEKFDAPDVIYGLLVKADQHVKDAEAKRDKLLATLATDRITNKGEFLAKLDLALVERNDRERANALLKHLKVVVHIGVGYLVTQAGICQTMLVDYAGKIGMMHLAPTGTNIEYSGPNGKTVEVPYEITEAYSGGANDIANQVLDLMKDSESRFLVT